MSLLRAQFPKFYEIVKKGGQGCLYYGFATSGNKVLCREGYKNAEAFLLHAKEVITIVLLSSPQYRYRVNEYFT